MASHASVTGTHLRVGLIDVCFLQKLRFFLEFSNGERSAASLEATRAFTTSKLRIHVYWWLWVFWWVIVEISFLFSYLQSWSFILIILKLYNSLLGVFEVDKLFDLLTKLMERICNIFFMDPILFFFFLVKKTRCKSSLSICKILSCSGICKA